MLKSIINVASNVEHILRESKEARDDDKVLWLYYVITHHELRKVFETAKPYASFQQWFLNESPLFESITRARRKLQEENPHLRGTKRQKRMEEEVKVRTHFRSI